MKTDPRLILVERQRRFEWELARDAQARVAAGIISGRTHDLLNFVQVVQLTAQELGRRHGAEPEVDELLADLMTSADKAHDQLAAMMAAARPAVAIVRGASIGPAIAAAVAAVRGAAIHVELVVTARPEVATPCSATELTHLIIGLALAATSDDEARATAGAHAIGLEIRERAIDGAQWLELLCGSPRPVGEAPFELRAVEAIVARCGGELSQSERRGGGSESIVALPVR
jgi:hypothetical protein